MMDSSSRDKIADFMSGLDFKLDAINQPDCSNLDWETVTKLVAHLWEAIDARNRVNEEFVARLAMRKEDNFFVFNEWVEALNTIAKASNAEIARIIGGRPAA